MALGRRCDIGCLTWPDDPAYKTCPVCGEKTKRYRGVKPADADEVAQAKFEAFYKEWDEKMPDSRLQMSPEQSLRWDGKYPNGRPDVLPQARQPKTG